MLDADLAELYQVKTRVLNQAVRRNLDRLPEEFMFQLTAQKASALRSQIVTLEKGRGRCSKYAALAFTICWAWLCCPRYSIADRAVQMNILIMRAFVRLREALARRIDELAAASTSTPLPWLASSGKSDN